MILSFFVPQVLVSLFEFDQAIACQRSNDWQASLSLLEMVLVDQPDNPLYLYHTGLAHYKLGNFEFAQNYFEKFAQNSDVKDVQLKVKGFFNQGNALYQLGKFESAIAAYDAALLLDTHNEYVLANKKLAEEKLKQQENQQSSQDQNESSGGDNQSNNGKSGQNDKKRSQSEGNKNQPDDQKQAGNKNQKPESSDQRDDNPTKNENKEQNAGNNNTQKEPSDKHDSNHESNESGTQQEQQKDRNKESDQDASDNQKEGHNNAKDGFNKERKKDSFDQPRHNQSQAGKKNSSSSIDEEKNQERIKKLAELEKQNDGLVDDQGLLTLLKDQETHDQKDNKALMRALAASKNGSKVQHGW